MDSAKPIGTVAGTADGGRSNVAIARHWATLGVVMMEQGLNAQALGHLLRALESAPQSADLHNCIGVVMDRLGRTGEALEHFDAAIRIRPDCAEARVNRACSWMTDGDFVRGLPEYEWRFKLYPNHRPPAGPRWDGGPLNGQTLLVVSEGGLGDSIHFCRYLRLAHAQGGTVIFACQPTVTALVATCPGIDRVVARSAVAGRTEPGVAYDTHISLLSLPGLFGIPPEAAPAPVPYVSPDPARVAFWRSTLASVRELRVGIAWQGSTTNRGDKFRSVPLMKFAPLAAVPGVKLFSLQKDAGAEQLATPGAQRLGVIDLGRRTASDLADVAALMMSLDLVIVIDTALAHVAGALGRPVWVAIPFTPDWRWGRAGETTTWYPSMRLFRQPAPGAWNEAFGRMATALARAVAERCARGHGSCPEEW